MSHGHYRITYDSGEERLRDHTNNGDLVMCHTDGASNHGADVRRFLYGRGLTGCEQSWETVSSPR